MWDLIMGQEETVSQLKKAVDTAEISHAYLFCGPLGVGKRLTAKVFASAVNCLQGGCGVCPICHRIQNDLHPDVVYVEPEGNFFTIGQVRELQKEANLKSFEAPRKFYILDDVDKMKAEAANALLKTLEEPPAQVVFILLTSNLDNLLPTVVSRCRINRFKSVSSSHLIDLLISKYQIPEVDAKFYTRLSGGVLTKALQFADSETKLVQRKMVLGIVEKIPRWDSFDLANAAEQMVAETKKSLEDLKKEQKNEQEEAKEYAMNSAHANRLKNLLGRKHKRRLNREERRSYREMLAIISSWYRDLMVLKETANPELLVNTDRFDLLKRYSEQFSTARIQEAIQIVQRTEERFGLNVNPQLALETMLFELKSLN